MTAKKQNLDNNAATIVDLLKRAGAGEREALVAAQAQLTTLLDKAQDGDEAAMNKLRAVCAGDGLLDGQQGGPGRQP